MAEKWNAFVNNPVAVSIITGIITFIITWPINNWLTKKTSKKDYYDRVEKTNRKIIEVCTDYVIMFQSGDDNVLGKIIKGLCIEGKINEEDAYGIQSVKAILIKEFVKMRLISDDIKKAIIQDLCKEKRTEPNIAIMMEKVILHEDKSKLSASLLGVLVSVCTVMVSLVSMYGNFDSVVFSRSDRMLMLIVTVLLLELTLIMLLFVYRRIKRERGEWLREERDEVRKPEKASAFDEILRENTITKDDNR